MAGKGDENDQMQETGSQDQNEGEDQASLQEEVAEDAVETLSDDTEYQEAIAERDARIGELEAQIAEAAKSIESANALAEQIEQLRADSAIERTDYELRLAGCRNAKAARALLDDHDGDITALKEAEPWLFAAGAGNSQGNSQESAGMTGLPNAGAATDAGRDVARWRTLAGLDDNTNE